MRIVVDTNIVFSAVLNTDSKIGEILLSSPDKVKFYSCNFLNIELENHINKLIKLSRKPDYKISEIIRLVYKQINFISEEQIPPSEFSFAYDLLHDIDTNDIPFLALTNYLNGLLWTGDKKLKTGLIKKNYDKVINTNEFINLLKII
jgi:predicted nucleic acid-binding protein